MSKIKTAGLPDFDPAEHLRDEADIAAYLTAALDENDPEALLESLGTVARARGMTEIAQESGLAREALYRALRQGSAPRFDTVIRVIKALGLHLTVTPDQRSVKTVDERTEHV